MCQTGFPYLFACIINGIMASQQHTTLEKCIGKRGITIYIVETIRVLVCVKKGWKYLFNKYLHSDLKTKIWWRTHIHFVSAVVGRRYSLCCRRLQFCSSIKLCCRQCSSREREISDSPSTILKIPLQKSRTSSNCESGNFDFVAWHNGALKNIFWRTCKTVFAEEFLWIFSLFWFCCCCFYLSILRLRPEL